MARITLNTDTTLSSAALALPENARIIVIDADTETQAADLTINGAQSLLITDDAVHISAAAESDNAETQEETEAADDFADAVITEMLNMLGVIQEETEAADDFIDTVTTEMLNMLNVTADDITTDTDCTEVDSDSTETHTESQTNTDNDADDAATTNNNTAAILTAIRSTDSAASKYTIHVEYDNENGVYTDHNTGAIITEETVIDIINCAYKTSADVSMTFDIPGHGMTTFIGDLADYRGYDGLVLVGTNGGAYVLSAKQELTDDMTVLTEAVFTFTGDAEALCDELEVTIIDANADAEEDDVHSHNTQTFNADAKLYTRISSREHNLNNTDIRRIVRYATTHNLSARLFIEDQHEPYVGRLQVATKDADTDTAQYVFVDKKRGRIEIDLDEIDDNTGFSVLEIYSDTDMHRRGFAGTNHADYAEISNTQMHKHLTAVFGE